ncbi:DNA-protecting protein DprA [Mycolicibacterium llatzerense]|uniref:DNA-protecting protein DprA n=1 Tax=Mycolicibacterium llatzerense TaxID=280871 RepID=UPI0021B68FC1|nr:DNA-protecting protein DprA [Mycolicibacterium llatzerense]MCT7362934.1 DNA processing protein DprA [Mycolicibacterium llatzerense]
MDTDALMAVATVMSVQELLPASPSDLTQILRNSAEREALLSLNHHAPSSDLVSYLCEHIDLGRREWWFKALSEIIESNTARPVLAGTPEYPIRLARCWDAPPVLFTTNAIPDMPAIAIIGSRDADDQALADAHELGYTLAQHDVAVVSGLAAGVDTQAHIGALAAGGVTLAVLGTGIRRIFPADNGPLSDEIRRDGVLISQFAPDAPRTGTTFLRRNHVIAGLSDISVVIDGRYRSGSRHEIEQAVGYGRPALLWEPILASQNWAQELADTGRAMFVSSAAEVLAQMGVPT